MQKRFRILIPIVLAFATLLSALACTGLSVASPSLIIGPSEEISLGAGEVCELSWGGMTCLMDFQVIF